MDGSEGSASYTEQQDVSVLGAAMCNSSQLSTKPNYFNNSDELRADETGTPFYYQHYSYRFDNKNEAEPHRNDHLRWQTWSCAALPKYQAAFHASIPQYYQINAGPSHDACGYCGLEFSNFPGPDWMERFRHMTVAHKFGKCISAKKFYRAEHFRQHLKHSHSGTSGWWTDILENACMEEVPPEPGASNPVSKTPRAQAKMRGAYGITRPGNTFPDSGTYTCIYHGCTLRFQCPNKLQQHKREVHRQATPSPLITEAQRLKAVFWKKRMERSSHKV